MTTDCIDCKPRGAPAPPASDPGAAKVGTPATADNFPTLGWPFAVMAAALINWDDARKREWAAIVAGDVNARERAVLDGIEAQAAYQKPRDDLVGLFVAGLRMAIEDQPVVTEELFGRVFANLPDVRQLQSDIAAIAEAVAELQSRRAGRAA